MNHNDGKGSTVEHMNRTAVVTGASSGIGAATARALRKSGWNVLAVARRADRLESLAAEVGVVPMAADLTDPDAAASLAQNVAEHGDVHALVHIAGGARGTDSVEHGNPDDWQWMFDINVLAAQRLVTAFLPLLRRGIASGGHADLLFLTSTASEVPYQGGAGYNASKAAERMLARVLRMELNGEPIRVVEVAPGMVYTEEFTVNRLRGDAVAAEAVYADVEAPLVAEDVASVIDYALNAPGHVNLDVITMRPVAQSAQHLLARGPLRPRQEH
jgi:NADP-dependent 3-hydroxy acid dehydrogenase YdfG